MLLVKTSDIGWDGELLFSFQLSNHAAIVESS